MHVIISLHALHSDYMHYIKLHTLGGFSTFFAGLCYPLTALIHAANMLNTHEDLPSRPATWMVSGFVPHVDPEIAKYPREGGNSVSVRNVELNQSVCSTHYMLLHALHAITYITCIASHYIKLHVVTRITCNCMHYKHYIKLHFVT